MCSEQVGQRQGEGKLLSCFHVACRDCLLENIRADNNLINCVLCQKSTAVPNGQVTHLPNAVTLTDWRGIGAASGGDGTANGAAARAVVLCDTCEEEEGDDAVSSKAGIAEHFCEDCCWSLCSECGRRHSKGRATRSHRLVSLTEAHSKASEDNGSARNCPIHPKRQLSWYCKRCNEFCCHRCLDTGAHCDKASHVVVDNEEEAKEVKSRLTGIRSEESCGEEKDAGDCFQKVQVELAAVEDKISAINKHTLSVSEKVNEFFSAQMDKVTARRDQLLQELDKDLWRKLKTMEDEKVRLMEWSRTLETITKLESPLSVAQMDQYDVLVTRKVDL